MGSTTPTIAAARQIFNQFPPPPIDPNLGWSLREKDTGPKSAGQGRLESLQESDVEDLVQEELQRPISRGRTPFFRSLSACNLSGLGQRGPEEAPPLPQMPQRITSPKVAGQPRMDDEEEIETISQGDARRPMSQPPLVRSRSFSVASTTGADRTDNAPPLPQMPPNGFTINVQPGPTGTSISFSNGEHNGQRDEYVQNGIGVNEFGSNSTSKANSIVHPPMRGPGEAFSPESRYFQIPGYPFEKPTHPTRSHQSLKYPFATVEELESDSVLSSRARRPLTGKGLMKPHHTRTTTALTSANNLAQMKYNVRSRSVSNIGTMGFGQEEDGKGFEITSSEQLESKENRHEYLLRLARALIVFGAPPHRLEEYLIESSAALAIKGQFMYIFGFMVCSFDEIMYGYDARHTESGAKVKIVRQGEGVDTAAQLTSAKSRFFTPRHRNTKNVLTRIL